MVLGFGFEVRIGGALESKFEDEFEEFGWSSCHVSLDPVTCHSLRFHMKQT